MPIWFVFGLSHKTAAIEVREKFCLRPSEEELLLNDLSHEPLVVEAMVLSTCNRTEIYAHMMVPCPEILREALCKIKNRTWQPDWEKYFYTYTGPEAVRHLFRVASDLDSLILGEKQILGQVRAAVDLSHRKQMMGKVFNILSNLAVRAGKKARNETAIADGGSSISWAAVTMAQNLLGTLLDKSVLIIGSGKMGKMAIHQMQGKKIRHLYVMNRTFARAVELAGEFGAKAVSFGELKEILVEADICICSADAPHYLIEKDLLERVMALRGGRKLVCIDISMSRNISPAAAAVNNVELITVDDLDQAIANNLNTRLGAVGAVEAMIDEKIKSFYKKLIGMQQPEGGRKVTGIHQKPTVETYETIGAVGNFKKISRARSPILRRIKSAR